MTADEFQKKYPQYCNLKITDIFVFDKTVIGKKLIYTKRINPALPEELKKDLIKTFGL